VRDGGYNGLVFLFAVFLDDLDVIKIITRNYKESIKRTLHVKAWRFLLDFAITNCIYSVYCTVHCSCIVLCQLVMYVLLP
jgi:hypothetical protein